MAKRYFCSPFCLLKLQEKTLTDLLIELNGIQWTLDPWKKSLRMKKVINFKVVRANGSSQTKSAHIPILNGLMNS